MFSPRYVWLMTENSAPHSTSLCSADQVGCAMRHQFFFSLKTEPNPSLAHIANHKVCIIIIITMLLNENKWNWTKIISY